MHGRTSAFLRRGPGAPTDLPVRSWGQALKRTAGEFKKDNLSDWAAALTYYSILSIFPAILVVVSLVGLAGQSATDDLIDSVGDLAPGSVRDLLISSIRQLEGSSGGAGVVAVLSLGAAVWSASGYVGAFMRASNVVYDVPEGRPFWKTVPIRVGVTLLTLVLLSASVIAVVVSGPLAREIGELLGLGSQAVTIWGIAKWPVLVLVVSLLFSLLYWASPNARRGFRWVTAGGVLAIVLWLAASGLFALYVANFASYNKTYGSLAGIIIFLVWLWITNLAILLGAELNAEIERGRAIAAGQPPRRSRTWSSATPARSTRTSGARPVPGRPGRRRRQGPGIRPRRPGGGSTEAAPIGPRAAVPGNHGSHKGDYRE
ncbi:YihY/virulence factor BrkB family protein [Actinomadura madurae]|uniref:YihY/virulence factor BrkB family protein n=1 Tax=Actinomadura madurae TaxID=1993 RepID=UPI0020D25A99|nr:YihY/virulence factor BrkB family protein [Actinomadura madurae]MCP9964351.1 YihY/virulence factor BrkB family protein [Actinomadura madurae]